MGPWIPERGDEMKVGIATFSSSRYTKYVGVGRYEQSLVSELNKMGVETGMIRVNSSEIGIHPALNRAWVLASQYLCKPAEVKKFDITHASSQFTATRYTDVVTVHDIIGMKDIPEVRQTVGFLERGLWSACLPLVRRAKHIISVSEATKSDIVKIASIPEERITVVHNGIDHSRFYPREDRDFKECLGVKPTLMYVGELRPYKNVQLTLKAMKILREKHNTDCKLILIGKSSPVSEAWWSHWEPFIRENGLDVERVTSADDEMLRKYYSNIDVFAWASLAEGFGLPPLEAMACGATVACLDNEINREVLGEGAFYSDPTPEGYAKTIMGALEGKKQQAAMNEWAKGFTWGKAARETKEVYERVLR